MVNQQGDHARKQDDDETTAAAVVKYCTDYRDISQASLAGVVVLRGRPQSVAAPHAAGQIRRAVPLATVGLTRRGTAGHGELAEGVGGWMRRASSLLRPQRR